MASKSSKTKSAATKAPDEPSGPSGITKITVRDFKSLAGEHSIEVRPLTILAGANSSGKSSIMQPLLLMKQTLEASYDPGPLLLDGPNVKLTGSDPLFTKGQAAHSKVFYGGIRITDDEGIASEFAKVGGGLELVETIVRNEHKDYVLRPEMASEDLKRQRSFNKGNLAERATLFVSRDRCFYHTYLRLDDENDKFMFPMPFGRPESVRPASHLINTIHLPGLRGNPARTYPVSATGSRYAGTFEKYAASIIYKWHDTSDPSLNSLQNDLKDLGLTWKVVAKQLNETQFELLIGRLPAPRRGGAHDLVNIADVGFGVSQTLPVVVALHAATPGQLIYIEQPEIHLHPRAQVAMAQVIANAAKRGVRIVVETHSDLMLLGIQTLVAEGRLPAEAVKLHWFERDIEGMSRITSRDLDDRGTFGDWPEDFGDIQMTAQRRYLDAAELRNGNY